MKFRCGAAFLLLLTTNACTQVQEPRPSTPDRLLRSAPAAKACGVKSHTAQLTTAPAAVLPRGTGLSFRQEPPVLTASHTGPVKLREFRVLGDVDEVRFVRFDEEQGVDVLTTFDVGSRIRRETFTEGPLKGHTVSTFELIFPAEYVDTVLRQETLWGAFSISWGRYLRPGEAVSEGSGIDLRFASTRLVDAGDPDRLPDVEVRVPEAGKVQYTSDVVNLRVEDFGDARARDQDLAAIDLEAVTKLFYQYFGDDYDILSITPQDAHISDYAGMHVIAWTDVCGVGLTEISNGMICDDDDHDNDRPFDETGYYGSGGALYGVQYYPQNAGLDLSTMTHEYAHQYGHYFDWNQTHGIRRAGAEPGSHTPLIFPEETLVGGLLEGNFRIGPQGDCPARTATLDYQICASEAPYRFHPLTLYAMGLMDETELASYPMKIFEDQRQGRSAPVESTLSVSTGDEIQGAAKDVSWAALRAHHGEYRGTKAPEDVRWATIVVSRDGLLSQEELNYWSWFTRRLMDPNNTGRIDFMGYGSLRASSNGAIRLDTGITPPIGTTGPQRASMEEDPPFSSLDWQGIVLESTFPSRFRVGEEIVVKGRVTLAGRNRYQRIGLEPYEPQGPSGALSSFYAPIDARDGSFELRHTIRPEEVGRYSLWFYLESAGSASDDRWLGPGRTTFRVE